MKTIVIYNSQTEFTKQYAQWISEAAGCECVSMKKAGKIKLADYKAMASKKDASESDRKTAEMISHSYDISDKKYIEPIVAEVK